MKSIHLSLAGVAAILVCICTGCSKDSQQTPALAIRHTKGLLATMGVNSSGKADTICFRFVGTSGGYDITDLTPKARTGGFVVRPRDLVEMAATSSGNWTFTTHAGFKLKVGSKENKGGNFTDRHHISFRTFHVSDSSQFITNDAGDGTFYIESAMHKGLFLITEPADVQPPRNAHESLRFDPAKKQKWFIVPW